METILFVQLLIIVPILVSMPLILALHFSRGWRYYWCFWLVISIGAAASSVFFFLSLTAPRPQVSGPAGPFGDAPIQALWLLAFLTTLPLLIYAFFWGRLRKPHRFFQPHSCGRSARHHL